MIRHLNFEEAAVRMAAASVVLVVLVFGGAIGVAEAQVNPRDVPIVAQPQQRFDGGQDIQPIFEGWTRNDDGSYLFHFGYLNRNYSERPSIPVGPENHFSPGAEDRGQPTYFYPRTQRYQFTVPMPADTGPNPEDGIIWNVTANGSEQQAYGWLQPEWEIDENTVTSNLGTGFGRPVEQLFTNQPPEIDVSASAMTVGVGEAVTLTAMLSDDELPEQMPPRRPRARLPTLIPPDDLPRVPDNIRWYRRPRPPRNGLALLWVVYRGPADANFEPSGYQRAFAEEEGETEVDGVATAATSADTPTTHTDGDGWTSATFEATVTFDEPGEYTLRGWASDAMFLTPGDVTITVR